MEEQIEHALAEIRPLLARHAGDIEFVGVSDGVVRVRLLGTCRGCPLSQLTLKAGVESLLCERIPSVRRVEAVDD
ncbi:NifU family protein [Candidatus Parcubacteria bacterium]|nr:MAG: NifU family protein [Candidatus Parcubacteria bacterium]